MTARACATVVRRRAGGLQLSLTILLAALVAFPSGGAVARAVAPAVSLAEGATPPGASALASAIASLERGDGPASGSSLACTAVTPTQASCSAPAPALASTPAAGGPPPGSGGGGEEVATNGTWSTVTQPRCCGGFVFDPRIGASVLFGGYVPGATEVTTLKDTWELQSGNWSRIFTPGEMSPHGGVAMTYDARDGYVLFFGGIRGEHYLAETWTFQSGAWSKLTTTYAPSARTGAAMAFDAADNTVVLFGGYTGSAYLSDTWYYAGGAWIPQTTSVAPPARTNASMVYDPQRGELLLFGGVALGRTYLGDTWAFVHGAWTQDAAAGGSPSPSPRASAGMTWDELDQEVVLMGGLGESGPLGDAWAYRADGWSSLPAGPSARYGPMMTFDENLDEVVLFGGEAGSNVYADTWLFSGGSWSERSTGQQPVGRTGASLTFDGATGEVLLFGGWSGAGYLGDTWSYSAGVWTLLSATTPGLTPREDAGIAYVQTGPDAAQGYVLLFGGYDGVFLNDTWAFAAGAWTRLNITTAPSPRMGVVLAPDGTTGSLLLVGGFGANGYLSDTWEFNASATSWSAVTNDRSGPGSRPLPATPRAFAASVFDPTSRAVLIFGGRNANGYLGDTWEVSAPDVNRTALWTEFNTTTSPSPRTNSSIGWDKDAPFSNAFLLGGTDGPDPSVSTLNDTWVFANGTWTYLPPPPPEGGMGGGGEEGETEAVSPAPRAGGNAVYSPSDGYLLFFGGSDGASIRSDTWVWVIFLAQPFASRTSVDAGVATRFQVGVFGGVAPYAYLWDFGDGSSSALANPVHTYAASTVTPYRVSVSVTDSAHNVSNRSLLITGYPALSVGWQSPGPGIDRGVAVPFSTELTGGAPPVRTVWTFGDGGRALSANTTHAFGTLGNFTVSFSAHSAGGSSVSYSATVHVVPVPSVLAVATPVETDVGLPVALAAQVRDGVGPFAFSWSFGDGGRATDAEPTHAFAEPGVYEVRLWLNDSFAQPASASTTVVVSALPAISAAAANPSTTDVGYAARFTAAGTGGAGGLSWAWSFGDGSYGVGPAPVHAYSAPGNYTVEVWANDSVGASAHALLLESVQPLPFVLRYTSDPSVVPLRELVTLSTVVGGGVAPYSYRYSNLPPGCSSTDTPVLLCAPTGAGSFAVTVHVTDALGAQSSAVLSLGVTSPYDRINFEPWVSPTIVLGVLAVLAATGYVIWRTSRRRAAGRQGDPPDPLGRPPRDD